MKVLEVVGCRSSVVRALVAKARGPGFDFFQQQGFFSHFAFPSFHRPINVRKFQPSFYEESELVVCKISPVRGVAL